MATYRSDVVGSLLRPPSLKDARQRHAAGEFTDAAFKVIEDRAVGEAIALQVAAGVDVLTDGETRRYAFFGHLNCASWATLRARCGPTSLPDEPDLGLVGAVREPPWTERR